LPRKRKRKKEAKRRGRGFRKRLEKKPIKEEDKKERAYYLRLAFSNFLPVRVRRKKEKRKGRERDRE